MSTFTVLTPLAASAAKPSHQSTPALHCNRATRSQRPQSRDFAQRVINVCLRTGQSLAIERLNTLANLTPTGSIGGWARLHLGKRVQELAELTGVTVVEVWPAGTSITCPVCQHHDKKNRSGISFRCISCGHMAHADLVAAGAIADRARVAFSGKQEGHVKSSHIRMIPLPISEDGGR